MLTESYFWLVFLTKWPMITRTFKDSGAALKMKWNNGENPLYAVTIYYVHCSYNYSIAKQYLALQIVRVEDEIRSIKVDNRNHYKITKLHNF